MRSWGQLQIFRQSGIPKPYTNPNLPKAFRPFSPPSGPPPIPINMESLDMRVPNRSWFGPFFLVNGPPNVRFHVTCWEAKGSKHLSMPHAHKPTCNGSRGCTNPLQQATPSLAGPRECAKLGNIRAAVRESSKKPHLEINASTDCMKCRTPKSETTVYTRSFELVSASLVCRMQVVDVSTGLWTQTRG